MQSTKIEWVKNPNNATQGYTSNPVKGKCPIACSYCYARALYDRFGWDKTIRFDVEELLAIEKHKKPAGIFLGSTFELFWDNLERFWQDSIFRTIRNCPQHRFYFLTKQPQNLSKFSPFPLNCWVGITVTEKSKLLIALDALDDIQCKVRYLSFEPLLSDFHIPDLDILLGGTIDWVIIGGQTGKHRFNPPEEWIKEIEDACDKARVPVFEKDNLRKIWERAPRQEVPSG